MKKRNTMPCNICIFVGVILFQLWTLTSASKAFGQEPPPLPFHAAEGVGGLWLTHSACLVNPPEKGKVFGSPSVGGMFVDLGHEKHLEIFTMTETLWGRVELGYGFIRASLGDLPQKIEQATTVAISDQSICLHNFNMRVAILQEGAFNKQWMPALTAGIHYKYNSEISDIDDELFGTLGTIGIKDNDGLDFTLYATKMLSGLPRPVMINAGIRSTKGAHVGLLGFTDKRKIVGEASIAVFITNRFIMATEYRQKPNEYEAIPGLIKEEEDWWSVICGYIINDRMTIGGGYGHFGGLLNHEANSIWGVALKYEF